MKLSGYLIEKYNNMGSAYTCRRLLEEAQKQNIDLRMIGVHDSHVNAHGCYNLNTKLTDRDFVLNRYKFGKVKDALNGLGKRSYNDIKALNTYINKLEQLKNISFSSVKKPAYISGFADLPFEIPAGKLKLPFVAKGLESSMGQEIFLIETEDDYNALLRSFPLSKEWIFQEFIAESYGHDMRLFCVRGEVIAAMERSSASDFRANVALGADVKPIKIRPEFQNIAGEIYSQTGLDFVGLDLLYGKDVPYFCEINVTAGIQGIEEACGLNVAGAIIGLVKGDFDAD